MKQHVTDFSETPLCASLQRRTIPLRQRRTRFIRALEKLQQHVVWRGGLPHILIQQDELGQLGAPEGTVRTDGLLCQSCRGWQHIGIEGRGLDGPAARPESTTALFV